MTFTDYSVTSAIPWNGVTYTGYTWYPVSAGTSHAVKCPNCGYCSCCGKSDVSGKATPGSDASD